MSLKNDSLLIFPVEECIPKNGALLLGWYMHVDRLSEFQSK
jgi:hypothetical protein